MSDAEQSYTAGYRAGRKAGYMDAIRQVWEIEHDLVSADPRRTWLRDLAEDLRARRGAALEED